VLTAGVVHADGLVRSSPGTRRRDLLEILEDHDAARLAVITSQVPRERWHNYFGEALTATVRLKFHLLPA
jgi:hypothetical protein